MLHFDPALGEGERPREPKHLLTRAQIAAASGLARTLALPGLDSAEDSGRLGYALGTMALTCSVRSSQPSINWKVWINTREPARGTPYLPS